MPTFVVFEGIDGSGKTTLSNLVASRLRDGGLRVTHVREGGTFASVVTQAMRELGRDARNLALTPRAELMLYLTREVQLVDEATRSALASMDVVIADRYVYTAEVLAVYGRGMAPDEVAPLVTAAAGGVHPDLVVLVDVDPLVARARRRVSKLLVRADGPPSRKGLAGSALQQRLRRGYRELAARDPERWVVVDNTEADLDALADALAELVRSGGAAEARTRIPHAVGTALHGPDLERARAALIAWIDRRAAREPGLAAYFLDGLWGDGFDERRRALAERVPAVIAEGLRLLDDPVTWELRHHLAAPAPDEVARSVVGLAADHLDAAALLRSLVARAPRGTSDALYGRDDELAWELREQLPLDAVLWSLGGVPGARGWELRERWLGEQGGLERLDVRGAAIACASVRGLPDDRAWVIRKTLRTVAPVAALDATFGLVDDRAWRWRQRRVERAPKIVMKSIAGLGDPRAWELRALVADHCEEAFDSLIGLDDPRAWALRDAHLDTWPATVVKSLGPLAGTDRGRDLITVALARHPENVAVWRQAIMRSN